MKLVLSAVLLLCLRVVGYLPSATLRKLIYRLFGMKIGKNSMVYMGAEIRGARNIQIGDQCSIGHRAILDGRGGLVIGNNVNLSTGVWFWTAEHDLHDPNFKIREEEIVVGDYVWISSRVTVLPGVRIGEGAVVAAGAVVIEEVEPYTIVGGVPAKVIGERSKDLHYQLKQHFPII